MNMKRGTMMMWGLLLVGLAVLFATVLHAEGEGSVQGMTLLEKIYGKGSGAFGISIQVSIMITSVIIFGWAIECFINIRQDKIVPPEVVQHVMQYVEDGDLEGLRQFCDASPNVLTRVMAAALDRSHAGFDVMSSAAEQQLSVEAGRLNHHISLISLCTALGPMLGLFGTVSGMVMAFDTMAEKGSAMSPGDVAASVGLALMSTVMGLIIAMPGMVFFWIFANRVTLMMDTFGGIIDEAMDRIRTMMAKQA
jgi:biopolymer transport protein ExbB